MILDDDISQKGHDEKEDEEDAMSSSSGISSSSFSNSSVYNRERTERMLDEILEDENEDIFNEDIDESSISCMDNIEEVKRINGRCITKSPDQNKQLIMHIGKTECLADINQLNRNSIVRRSKSLPTRDAISIQLSSSKDVNVQMKDFNGREISVDDVDLELHLSPQQLIASSLRQNDNVKYRVKNMLSRLTKPNCQKRSNSKSTTRSSRNKINENVVYIKDKITLKDSVNGTEFEVEMDLKVEIEDPDQICRLQEIQQIDGDSSSDNDSNTQNRRRSASCGRGVRQALAGRLCKPLFGGSTSRLDQNNSPKNDRNSLNSNICAASCISAPWKRRLRRRQSKYQQTTKESLARSKSLDLPKQKEVDVRQGEFIDDLASPIQQRPLDVGQQVFQSALKECAAIPSTPNTQHITAMNKISSKNTNQSPPSNSENTMSNFHPNLKRMLSDNNIINNAAKETRSGSNPSIELRRLYHKKNEIGDKRINGGKHFLNRKGGHGYSTNDLISYARQQPILSQKSYEALNKSQADLFRITAV